MFSFLQFTTNHLLGQGYTLEEITENTGIDASAVNDPWPFLSSEQYSSLVHNIYRITDEASIGLTLGKEFKITSMGVLGFASMVCDTFAQARQFYMRYRLLTNPGIYITHSFGHNNWVMNLGDAFPMQEDVKRFTLENQISFTRRFCEEITQSKAGIVAINLDYPKPLYADKYTEALQVPVNFEQPRCNVVFELDLLDTPLPMANREMFSLCERECQLRFSQLDAAESVKKKVYQELYYSHFKNNGSLPKLGEIAERLHISPRTLRRKLLAEGSNFQKITNEVYRELATHYLHNSPLSTKEIAYALGYSSVNNFHRAFKEWVGGPISSYRACTPGHQGLSSITTTESAPAYLSF